MFCSRDPRNPLRQPYELTLTGDDQLSTWVLEPGSMTRAIARYCGERPRVRVHKSEPDRPERWEADLLRLPSSRPVFCREISLRIQDRDVLQARSVAIIGGSIEPRLRGLGNKPLAELLFVDPLWQREIGPLPLAPRRHRPTPGRVCVWRYHGRRPGLLLVAEYFLPELLNTPRR